MLFFHSLVCNFVRLNANQVACTSARHTLFMPRAGGVVCLENFPNIITNVELADLADD